MNGFSIKNIRDRFLKFWHGETYEHQNPLDRRFTSFTELFKANKLLFIFITIVPIALYWKTYSYEMVWDDASHLVENPYFDPINFKNLLHFWTEIHWGLYVPVTYTLWAGLYEFSSMLGLEPENMILYHFVNILLHTFNGLLVFTLLSQFIRNRWYVLIGTLIFLVHPLQVETVAWVSEFRGLLSFAFGFCAIYFNAKSCHYSYNYNLKKLNRYLWMSLILFTLGILSKPSIIVLIFFIPLIEFHLYKSSLKNIFKRVIPFVIPVAAIIIITMSAQGNVSELRYALWIRPFIFSDSILFYLKKFLLPINLAASYARTTEILEVKWWFYTNLFLLVGIAVLLFKYRAKLRLINLGLVLFILGILTVSGLIWFDFQLWSNVADRYLYISMFGISLSIAAFLELLNKKTISTIIFSIILLILTILTIKQIPVWKNEFTVWDHTISITPQEHRAWLNRGAWYSSEKRYDLALSDYFKSIEINSYDSDTHYNIGLAYYEMKKYREAINYFDAAIDLKENHDYMAGRARAYVKLEEYVLAVRDFYEIIKKGGGDQEIFYELGCVNLLVEQYKLAIDEFNKSLALDDTSAKAYYNRGFAYMKLKDYDLAIKDYRKAIALNPKYDKAAEALDLVLKRKQLEN